MNPELVFLHIPKTAGTSQHRSFRIYYGKDNIFWFGEDCPGSVRHYPRDLVGNRLLVGGHKQLSFYPPDFDPLFCAVLRDPVERAISLFVYYTQPALARNERARRIREEILSNWRAKGIDPDSMLQSIKHCRPFREEITNIQCAYVSGKGATCRGALTTLQERDFILGTMDSYANFHKYLADILDWPEEDPGALNRSRSNYASHYLDDDELVATLCELNQEDDKLLEFVRRERDGLYINLRNPEGRRKRLDALPLKPWMSRSLGLDWQEAAATLWPRRRQDGPALPWPLGCGLVAQSSRLFYMSVPGPADSFVKQFMLDCAKIEHATAVPDLGLGRVLAQFETGLMLRDYDPPFVRSVRRDKDYFKFAVVGEPVARLVRAYADNFVIKRGNIHDKPQLAELLSQIQGGKEVDLDRGVSFREFVDAVLCRNPTEQHPLWIPQYLYLKGMGEYDKLYRDDQLDILANDLQKLSGVSLSVPPKAPAPGSSPLMAGEGMVSSGSFADVCAADLPTQSDEWRSGLVDQDLFARIMAYYAQDCSLYDGTADNRVGES